MLAKVVKNGAAANIAAPAFAALGGANATAPNGRSVERLVVPDLRELLAAPAAAAFEDAPEPAAETADAPAAQFVEPAAAPFVDPAPQIEEMLQNARDEAARIIAEAERNADFIAQAAAEKAEQEVRARFEAEVAARADEIRAELARTIERIASLSEEITRRHESELIDLALAVAKKVVAREVTIDREIALTLVRVSLGKLHDRAVAEVHLNPEDFEFVNAHRERLDFRGALEIVEDKSVAVGGCLIHTETGDIDARIESQFEEIAHGLMQ